MAIGFSKTTIITKLDPNYFYSNTKKKVDNKKKKLENKKYGFVFNSK